jgi:hypothetical protein
MIELENAIRHLVSMTKTVHDIACDRENGDSHMDGDRFTDLTEIAWEKAECVAAAFYARNAVPA